MNPTHNDSWEERFEEKFCTVDGERYANIVNGDWPVKKELIKLFISTEIAAAEKRKVADVVDFIKKHSLIGINGFDYTITARNLEFLQADNETGV